MSEYIKIRPARRSDAVAIFGIMSRARQNQYTNLIPENRREDFMDSISESPSRLQRFKELFEKKLSQKTDFDLLVLEGAKPIGYCAIRQEDGYWYISHLHVDTTEQGKGYGSLLLKEAIKRHKESTIKLHVLKANKSVIGFYEKAGFKQKSSEESHYYGAPRVLMVLTK